VEGDELEMRLAAGPQAADLNPAAETALFLGNFAGATGDGKGSEGSADRVRSFGRHAGAAEDHAEPCPAVD
jgi:hypothetical protein